VIIPLDLPELGLLGLGRHSETDASKPHGAGGSRGL
jgi:hypothetical protein